MPTTQVKLTEKETPGYDPLSTVSVMDQLRTAKSDVGMPSKLPGLSNLPVTKQFQVLGVLLVVFLLLAVVMIFVDGRQAAQSATATATATEMQMLSQRLARGAALAAQGKRARSRRCATAAIASKPTWTRWPKAATSGVWSWVRPATRPRSRS